VFDGHLVVDDESEVRARGGAVLEKIWKTLGSGGYLTN